MAEPKRDEPALPERNKVRAIGGASAAPAWLHRVSFEEGPEAIVILDTAYRTVVDANRSAEELTGFSRPELLDMRLEDFHPRADREKVIRYFNRMVGERGYAYDDVPLETKDGGTVPVEAKGGVIGFGGGRVVQVVFHDISRERLLQREVLFLNLKLTLLNALSSATSKSLDLSEIMADSLKAVMEASGCLYGEMLLRQDDGQRVKLVSYRGEGKSPPESDLPLASCPLAAQALKTGKPILLEDLEEDPRLAQILRSHHDIGAVAGVPLRSKNRVLGVMHLAIGAQQLFPTFDFDLFTSIGNQIGLAAENALLYQQALGQTNQIAVLNSIARIIGSSLQIEQVFDAFASEMEKLVKFDRLSVAFLDPSGDYLRIFASGGARRSTGWGMESIIPLVGTGPGWVVIHDKPFIHPDTAASRNFIEDEMLFEDGIRSYILLPLEARRKVIGTFGLGSSRPAAFSERHLPLLTQLSKQIAVAIDNVQLYQRTKETSILDDVSSLFNFRYFHQTLDRELKLVARHRSPLSLIFIDMDNFKPVNDQHGHMRGSKVLREVGFLLRAAIRDTDVAARYGGDEFVVILPDTDQEAAGRMGERIRKLILGSVFLQEEGLNIRLGASIGVATYPTDALSKEELIRIADERMYHDKEKNRARRPRE
jgi:diguanylate cyclase (GGDEF)-like protein/PAS domain S-box-containing protein